MAQKILNTDIIKQRTDTTANWESKNPILAKGEIGIEETTTGEIKQKIGNGTSRWKVLPYSYLTSDELSAQYIPKLNGGSILNSDKTQVTYITPANISLSDEKYKNNIIFNIGSNSFSPYISTEYKDTLCPTRFLLGVDNGRNPLINVGNPVNGEDAVNLNYANSNYLRTGYGLSLGRNDNNATLVIRNTNAQLVDIYTYNNNTPSPALAIESQTSITLRAPYIQLAKLGGGQVPLRNIAYPENSTDAVNKQYVDANFISSTSILKLNKSSATSYLALTNNGQSTVTLESLNTDSTYKPTLNIISTASVQIHAPFLYLRAYDTTSAIKIRNLATPTEATDAANKSYVDESISNIPSYNLPIASTTILGGIKVGENLSITADGTLSAIQSTYTLPLATDSVLGGVKIGANITTTEDGTISVAPPGISQETADTKYLSLTGGTISGNLRISKPDQSYLYFESSGVDYKNASAHIALNNDNYQIPTLEFHVASEYDGYVGQFHLVASEGLRVSSDVYQTPTKITGLDTPTELTDAANKEYVDTAISNIPTYTLPVSTTTTLGGVIVGDNLTVDSTGKLSAPAPGISQGVADTRYLQLTGGSVVGQLAIRNTTSSPMITMGGTSAATINALNSNGAFSVLNIRASQLALQNGSNVDILISGVATPTGNNQAANKAYVDAAVSNIPTYSLPIASASALGGVKIGANVTVAADGTISVAAPGISASNPNDSKNELRWSPNGFIIYGTQAGLLFNKEYGQDFQLTALKNNGTSATLDIAAEKVFFREPSNGFPIRVAGIATPQSDNDATNKAYVDTAVAGAGSGLPTTNPLGKGDIAWGQNDLNIGAPPYNNATGEPNRLVIASILSGDSQGVRLTSTNAAGLRNNITLSGTVISVMGSRIVNVATPTSIADAANKGYVDSRATALETSIATLSARSSPVSNITYTDNSSTSLLAEESSAPPINILQYIFSLSIDFSKNLVIEFDIENVSQYSSLFIRHEVNDIGNIINSLGDNSLTLFSTEQNKEISVIDYTITAINDTDRHYKLTIIPNSIFKQNPYHIDIYGVKS